MRNDNYFIRVSKQTETRMWINNVTIDQARRAIKEGAVCCTQNPSYVWKMISNEDANVREHADSVIRKYLREFDDDDMVMKYTQRELIGEIAKEFLPLYIESNGKYGYVSIQGDPSREESDVIIEAAKFNREESPNMMIKVPVIKNSLSALRYLVDNGYPINATEVMSLRQAMDVTRIYHDSENRSKAPLLYSHITGVLDEYLKNYVKENNIEIEKDIVFQAGIAAAKKTYWTCRTIDDEVGFIGGGARGTHHFTEMVGAKANITINWKGTADKLIEEDPPVVQRFFCPTQDYVVDRLCAKIPDFRKAYFETEIEQEEYEDFGPVVLFRSGFVRDWENALKHIKELRESGE